MRTAEISTAFAPSERTLPAMLERQARRYKDRPLLTAGETTWTFDDARAIAARFAGTLHAAGVRAGDRVALMCSNRTEFVQVYLGCAWLGAVAVPINVASRGPQLEHILSNSGAKLLIIEASLLDAMNLVNIDKLALDLVWLIDEGSSSSLGHVPVAPLPPLADQRPAAGVGPETLAAIL
jgi:carnitine-CoA ligase